MAMTTQKTSLRNLESYDEYAGPLPGAAPEWPQCTSDPQRAPPWPYHLDPTGLPQVLTECDAAELPLVDAAKNSEHPGPGSTGARSSILEARLTNKRETVR